nr:immunoglobulin light chain junction region [Macaca mulatta]
CHHSYGTPYSF